MLWLACIFLLLFLLLFFLHKKEGFESNALSIVEFNQTYETDIVALPKWLFALGVTKGEYHTCSSLELYAETLVEYWIKHLDPSLPPKYYAIICPMDGLGNNGNMTEALTDRTILPEDMPEMKQSIGYGPYYPVFHSKKILYAMCKNVNDNITVLLPDAHFIRERAYSEKKDEIDQNRKPYAERKSECIWRGTLDNGSASNFIDPQDKTGNPRQYFQKLYQEGRFQKVQFDEKETSITEQIQYKMILDIDGWTATWSALVWKLYSGSVVLRTESKWKQWYSDKLEAWVHYVPVENDYSDLNDKIEWCLYNEKACIEIAENARNFVQQNLNWEKVKQDTIATVRAAILSS